MTDSNEETTEETKNTEITINQNDLSPAQAQEQALLSQATELHLLKRVAMLRALVNKQQSEIDDLKAKISPEGSSDE